MSGEIEKDECVDMLNLIISTRGEIQRILTWCIRLDKDLERLERKFVMERDFAFKEKRSEE